MKAKTVKGNWRRNKLGLPSVFLVCIFFFLSGFFASNFYSRFQEREYDPRFMLRQRPGLLEKSTEYHLLKAGDSGDNYVTLIPFQVLSWYPRALYFPNFASAEQCESIIEMARRGLKPSTLALRKGETEQSTKGIRTSYGVFMSASEDETGILDIIEEKIAKATKIPRNHGEAFNILRYEAGQKYDSHYDAFDFTEYSPQKSQRVASFLLYLTDVPEGGETVFPFENGFNMDGSFNFEDFIGFKVKPRMGDGILFYSLLPNGTIDLTSLHGSCPVIKGEKWVATKWIRDKEQDDYMNVTTFH